MKNNDHEASTRQISSRQITRYAKVCATHNRLEKLRYVIRDGLLEKLNKGYSQSKTGPFVLDRTSQSRLDSDQWTWKLYATELAIKLSKSQGLDDMEAIKAGMEMVVQAELAAPRKDIDVLSAKPNPSILEELLRKM